MEKKLTMDELMNFCKTYGYIFQGSEIYGGLANTWDYGPLGSMLKQNIKNAWIKKFVQECPYNYNLDAAILMNPEVWVASGHVTSFSDPLIDCKHCKSRFRADKLVEEHTKGRITGDGISNEELVNLINELEIKCPKCHGQEFTDIRNFNLLFETYQGVTDDTKNKVYLRGETAQGIFVNYKNVERSMRAKLPFGICQIGKAFRNEITPGNFIFRTREFEQMELEFFCKPGTDIEWFGFWKNYCLDFLETIGISKENIRLREHKKEELVFYSAATTDIEYNFPFGFGELWGIADRTNYDLSVHENHSKQDLKYLDPESNGKYLPYVIEPSVGVDRLLLSVLTDAYTKELVDDEERLVLKLHPALSPIKATILPLVKKVHAEKGMSIYNDLVKYFSCSYDESGSIGKRYRRSDAIGTPFAITVDDETLNNNMVTVRSRDTMEQISLSVDELKDYIESKIVL